MPDGAPWSRARLITDLACAVCASGLIPAEFAARTGCEARLLEDLVMRGSLDGMRWPEDFRALCRALYLSADDLLGLQERDETTEREISAAGAGSTP